jgi:signal peptidase I
MEPLAKITNRDKKKAVLASLIMPGMGQIYNGELIKGVCFFILVLAVPLLLLRITMWLPDRLLLLGASASLTGALAVCLLSIVDAARTASATGAGYILKSYNRWYIYALLGIVCSCWLSGMAFSYTQDHILQFCRIVSSSMEPALLKGDFVLFDKSAAGRFTPHKGDVVIFRYPDDPAKIYVKRIAGLPGDTLSIDNLPQVIVPHGDVFVLGDNRAHAVDSRSFGPIPIGNIIGKARQIYFSFGPEGIRWERMGQTLP